MPMTCDIDPLTNRYANMDISNKLQLLKLPPEIRLRIYSFVFHSASPVLLSVKSNGQLFQPPHDAMRQTPHKHVNLSAQFLRTCYQVYHEGLAYLFSMNTLQMLDIDTHNLSLASSHLTVPTRAFMSKLEFLNRPNKRLNLPSVNACFPSLRTIHIHTQGSGASFLILAYELAKSLPCSPIRPWPTLELQIHVPTSSDAIKQFETMFDGAMYWQVNDNVKDGTKVEALFRNWNLRLNDLEPYVMKYFRLGEEVPAVDRIVLHGGLPKKHVHAVTSYESTYGDCRFEFIRKGKVKGDTDRVGTWEMSTYLWHREGAAVATAVRGKDLSDTATLMRQWVPSLSQEFLDALKEAYSDQAQA